MYCGKGIIFVVGNKNIITYNIIIFYSFIIGSTLYCRFCYLFVESEVSGYHMTG